MVGQNDVAQLLEQYFSTDYYSLTGFLTNNPASRLNSLRRALIQRMSALYLQFRTEIEILGMLKIKRYLMAPQC